MAAKISITLSASERAVFNNLCAALNLMTHNQRMDQERVGRVLFMKANNASFPDWTAASQVVQGFEFARQTARCSGTMEITYRNLSAWNTCRLIAKCIGDLRWAGGVITQAAAVEWLCYGRGAEVLGIKE